MPESTETPWEPNDLAIKLKVFEGPLDLLIFLIRKNELDIYDIPMETVTSQYIQYLHNMEKLNLEIAGDFFVMASTLMYIKSRMLLPPREQIMDDGPEDEQDPRWELVQQLLEYRRYKDLANQIEKRIEERNQLLDRVVKSHHSSESSRPLEKIDRLDLWNIINQVYLRLAEKMNYGEIEDEPITVADRMEYILERMKVSKKFFFSELFENYSSLITIVTTFLALLELTRLHKLTLQQSEAFTDIECFVY
jgi:segregation and condensation protein A